MASARLRRREKQYKELARENEHLNQDVEDLETAVFLHRQVLQEEENSVKGMIRKEVGGPRWQHGGVGKLTTYKSSKDLQDSVTFIINGSHITDKAGSSAVEHFHNRLSKEARERKPAQTSARIAKRNEKNTLFDDDIYAGIDEGTGNRERDKILDLKSKVLKKASSKVIKRDTWQSPNRQADGKQEITRQTSAGKTPVKVSKDVVKYRSGKQEGKTKAAAKQKSNSFKENIKLDAYDFRNCEGTLNQTAEKLKARNGLRNEADDVVTNSKAFGTRLSRKDLHVSDGKMFPTDFDDTHSVDEDTFTEEDKSISDDRIVANRQKVSDATEIFIDPNNAEVRIRTLTNGNLNDFSEVGQTKVLVQRDVNLKASADEPKAFKFSVTERDKCSIGEIRDVFGLQDLETKSVLPYSVSKTVSSLSPLALTKDCDTEVEFWLRGLGLSNVDEYVEMFAENEIDLLDLEFMSAAQLQDMGVTDSDALDVLLNGVRELRNLPPDKMSKRENVGVKRGLQATSIAWEEVIGDDRTARQSRKKTGKIENLEYGGNKTFTEERCGSLNFANTSRLSAEAVSHRSKSAMSYNSDDSEIHESSRASSRNQNSAQSRANNRSDALPRAYSRDQYSAYERTSSKTSSAKTKKLPPNAKSQNQKKTTNIPNKKEKPQDQGTESKSRLHALEARPTRSVLLKRSASLTRETGRGQNRKEREQEEPQNKKQSTRGRSRSAEAVRRKALEGVQAAVRRHEEQQRKDREKEEIKNKIQERKKVERDEMAARHLQRERKKAPGVSETVTAKDKQRSPSPTSSPDLESLVTVNILSHPKERETVGRSHDTEEERSKTRVIASSSQTQKSLRRIEPAKKLTGKTFRRPEESHLQENYEEPVLSTCKLETRTKEGASSEPESGYRTDTSATYSQVEEKVAEIQTKIKRLKSQALSGDEVTLTLVKDLQAELQHFEKLLTEKEASAKKVEVERWTENSRQKAQFSDPKLSETNRASSSTKVHPHVATPENQSKSSPRKPAISSVPPSQNQSKTSVPVNQSKTPLNQSTVPLNQSKYSAHDSTPRQENSIEELLMEDSLVKGEEFGLKTKIALSMSKKELLDEMRKEKHQHQKQIRQLQSELQRMRETDAASTMELNHADIDYREEDLIGEGTFSKVFRGTYQGAEVAVKRLVVPLAAQDKNYFAAEVSLLRELRHPRVVLLIGVCVSDKLPLMVLEYMSGGSLFNHLHSEHSMPLDHAEYYQVARDIALGMNYLHSHKPEVLHLDLKSMNVLLCQSFRAKIADFGFSKLRHDVTTKLAKKGKGHTSRGSPAWMSPELIDKGEITCKADVYSFAIILWEMLTRQLPYENVSVFQVLEIVRKNKRPEIPSSCPKDLGLLISRCWDQNPAKRPQFKEIVSSLENLAFPSAWRQLFKKAGVPEEALHNIESTRTLINLVRTKLDSNSFSSFMIGDSRERKDSSGDATSVTSGDTTASTCILRKTTQATDDWECCTVSDISEIPNENNLELSLGTARDSYDESSSDTVCEDITENLADESSDYSSDEDSIILPLSSPKSSPHKKLNVFVPSLELSVKSPVPESSKDETSKFDWVSISLEDRSYREFDMDRIQNPDREVMGLNLSSKSNRIVATLSPVAVSSARENEQGSWKKKAKEMEERTKEVGDYLMRESLDNRRPASPVRKRLSLTKKLAGRTAKSLDTDDDGASRNGESVENYEVNNRMAFTERLERVPIDNARDLESLNVKLAALNEKYDKFDRRLTNLSQNSKEKFRQLVDTVFDIEDTTAVNYSSRSSFVNDSHDISDRSTRKKELFNDKSYDSFYSLPVRYLPHENNTSKKSETLIKCTSFTKSKDVLDLLSEQISQTTKTLEEMDGASSSTKTGSGVCKCDEYWSENLGGPRNMKGLPDHAKNDEVKIHKAYEITPEILSKSIDKLAKNQKSRRVSNEKNEPENLKSGQQKEIASMDGTDQDAAERATIRRVADHYKSKNIFPDKNVNEIDDDAKEMLKQKHIDDYHEFVKTEILHDAGGFIDNLKSLRNENAGEKFVESGSDESEQNNTVLDESVETVMLINEEIVKEVNPICSDEKQTKKNMQEPVGLGDNSKTVNKDQKKEAEDSHQVEEENTHHDTNHRKAEKEEKESVRVILNPVEVLGRKPVKTPRRSKMKENQDIQHANSTKLSLENVKKDSVQNKIPVDKDKVDLVLSRKSNDNVNKDNVYKDEAMRKLQDLEEFSEIQSEAVDDNESPEIEKFEPVERVKRNEKAVTPERKKDYSDNDIVTKPINTDEPKCSTPRENPRTKLLPKEEHWRRSPEKPKKTAYVLRHPSRKRTSDESKISPTSEIKKTQQETAVPKSRKDDLPKNPKKTIRVKLKKDPLSPPLSEGPPSPVPPAPPPPPLTSLSVSAMTFSKSVQIPKSASSMADELKLRVASWQSRSFHRNPLKSKQEPAINKSATQSKGQPAFSKRLLDSVIENEAISLEDSLEDMNMSDDQNQPHKQRMLIPKLSEGLPELAVKSVELRDQRDHLRSISKPHPDQLDDLSHVSQEQLLSIAELLRKAVMERRLALGEDSASVDQSIDSVSWSVETTPRP